MTHRSILLLVPVIFTLNVAMLSAGEPDDSLEDTRMVIALQTDDFELAETDISDLAVGDAETIYTESGRTIDLLRTEDGVEVYVDGELMHSGHDGGNGHHESHYIVHQDVEVECDSDEECEEMITISEDWDVDVESAHGRDHHEKIVIIRKESDSD